MLFSFVVAMAFAWAFSCSVVGCRSALRCVGWSCQKGGVFWILVVSRPNPTGTIDLDILADAMEKKSTLKFCKLLQNRFFTKSFLRAPPKKEIGIFSSPNYSCAHRR